MSWICTDPSGDLVVLEIQTTPLRPKKSWHHNLWKLQPGCFWKSFEFSVMPIGFVHKTCMQFPLVFLLVYNTLTKSPLWFNIILESIKNSWFSKMKLTGSRHLSSAHVALPKSFSFPQLSFASHVHLAWLPRSSALSQPPPAEENTGDEKHWGCFYGENTCMINVLIVHLLLPGLNFGKSENTVSLMVPEQWNNKPQV